MAIQFLNSQSIAGGLTIDGKATSSPTIAADAVTTLTTKGYVDSVAGGTVTGTGANKQVTYWTSSSNIDGDNSFKYELDSSSNALLDLSSTGSQQIRFFDTNSAYSEAMRLLRFNDKLSITYGDNANEEALTVVGTGSTAGNVGIGTTGPTALLEVKTDNATIYDSTSDSGQDNGTATILVSNDNVTTNTFSQIAFHNKGSNRGVSRIVSIGVANASTDLAFVTENNNTKSEKMRILANGNVGIGTASPAFTSGSGLEIEKSGTATLRLQSSGSNASEINQTSSALQIVDLSSGTMLFKVSNDEKMRITSAGNVGIGITPTSKLHISTTNQSFSTASGNAVNIAFPGGSEAGDIGGGLVFSQYYYSGSAAVIRTGGIYGIKTAGGGSFGGGLAFYTQPQSAADMVQRMVINNLGNVGIGTDTPADVLHVKNADSVGGNSRCDIRLQNGTGYAEFGALSGYARIQANGAEAAALSTGASYFYGTNWTFGSNNTTGTDDGKLTINGSSGTGGEAYLNLSRNNVSGFILNHTANAIQVRATANIPMFFYTNDTLSLKINANNTISFPTYGAGTLVTDSNGLITSTSTPPGTGTFLPLAGGTMDSGATITTSGTLSIVGNSAVKLRLSGGARIQLENANVSDSFYISNTGGNLASTLDLGGTLSIVEGGTSTFSGNVIIGTVDTATTGLSIGEASPTIQLFDTTNDAKLLIYTQDSSSVIGTYSNHALNFFTNSTLALSLDTSQNATFAGKLTTADDITISNGSPELYMLTGATHYNWMLAAQENIDAAFEITPSTVVDGTTFSTPVFSVKATGAATFAGSINMTDNKPINYGGQTMFTHTGSQTRIGDNTSSNVLTIGSGNATFTGDVNINGGDLNVGNSSIVNSVINMLGTNDSFIEKDTGNHLYFANNVGDKDIKFRVKDNTTNIIALTLDGSEGGNAIFAAKATSLATAASDGSTTLTTKSYVDGLVTGVPVYKGTWNATTNSPDLTLAAAKVLGNYYIVDTSGDFAPNGVGTDPNSWVIGDWCIFSDITSGAGTDVWQKIDNTSVISGAGTGSTLTLWAGLANADSETLTDSIITQSTGQPQIKISSTNDAQLVLHSTNTWSGIYFDDDGASPDYIFHNAGFGTFAIGGGGSNVLNKKLHVHGAQTIGVNYVSTAVPVGGLLVEGKVGIGTTNTTTGYLVLPGEESAEFKIAFTGASASSGLSTVDQSGAGLYIGANSRVNTSGVAIANNTALASNGIYFDAWNGDDIEFYTGASGNPGVRMRINTTGSIQFSNYGGTNKIGIPTYLLGTDASGNIVKADSQNGLGFAPAINFIRNGINSTTYTMIATVNGDGLSSIIQMSITGTSGNVVLNSLFDISVSHSQDIHVTSQSGDYSEVTLRITSNNNEDFSIEAKHNGSTATNAEIWIYPKAGETVTPTTVDPNFSGSEYEHIATEGWRFGGEDNNVESSQVIIDDKLGIGTTTPELPLEVNGSILVDVFASTQTEEGIFFRPGFTASDKYNISILAFAHESIPSFNDGLSINGYDGVSFCTGSNTRSEKMRITAAGFVGIGTISPNDILHVSKAGAATRLRVGNNGAHDASIYFNTSTDWSIGTDTSNSNALTFGNSSAIGTANKMVIRTDGNVSIGTTDYTSAKLNLGGSIKLAPQGHGVIFGDSTAANPITIREGLVGTEGSDSDRICLYSRNSLSIFTYPNVTGGTLRSTFSSSGLAVVGNIAGSGDLLLTTAASKVQITGTGYMGADDNFYLGSASSGTDHTYIGDTSRNVSIFNGAIFTVQSGDVRLSGTGRIQGVDTVTDSTDAVNKAYVDARVSPPSHFNQGFKTLSVGTTFISALTVSLAAHTGCYVTLCCFGDWGSHSSAAYRGEFFLQNGGGAFNEPGIIIRQDDNTSDGTDQIICQIVDPAGSAGNRDFVIQIKHTDTTSPVSFVGTITYTVQGKFNSVT